MGIEIERAHGIYLYSPCGRRWADLCAGVSVSALGHGHPRVLEAAWQQMQRHMHLMVYGEYIIGAQALLAQKLASLLPSALQCVYFVNSGSEAIEAALKLAKRFTRRHEIICMNHAYHGGTHGALSMHGSEDYKRPFRPLLPDVRQIRFNCIDDLELISRHTACVVAEPIQAEAGVALPSDNYLPMLRRRCSDTGALLILDEVQTAMGRTGSMFAFERYGIVPDMLVLAKALGGGMPLGALVSSHQIMSAFMSNPVLGHITTFGGHPVSCAASLAMLEVIIEEGLAEMASAKSALFKGLLSVCPAIAEVRGEGLLLAARLRSGVNTTEYLSRLLAAGIATDGFLYCPDAFRIAPPLTITEQEIRQVCSIINSIA
jgi:acetylornithine/succinyldiaminopimelate/putrescine aminotransferase